MRMGECTLKALTFSCIQDTIENTNFSSVTLLQVSPQHMRNLCFQSFLERSERNEWKLKFRSIFLLCYVCNGFCLGEGSDFLSKISSFLCPAKTALTIWMKLGMNLVWGQGTLGTCWVTPPKFPMTSQRGGPNLGHFFFL